MIIAFDLQFLQVASYFPSIFNQNSNRIMQILLFKILRKKFAKAAIFQSIYDEY